MANLFDALRDTKAALDALLEVGEFRGATLANEEVVEARFKALREAVERGAKLAEAGGGSNVFEDMISVGTLPGVATSGMLPPTTAVFGSVAGGGGAMSVAAEAQKAMLERASREYEAALLPGGRGGAVSASKAVNEAKAIELLRKLGIGREKGA